MAKTDEKRQRPVNHGSVIDSAVLNQVSEKLDQNKRTDAYRQETRSNDHHHQQIIHPKAQIHSNSRTGTALKRGKKKVENARSVQEDQRRTFTATHEDDSKQALQDLCDVLPKEQSGR